MPTSRKNEISKAWINDLYADEKWWIETKSQISISSPPLAVVFCAWCRWRGYGSKKLPPSLTWPITLPLILFFLTKLGQVLADVINGVRHSTHTGLYSYLRPELHIIIKFMPMFIITKTIHLVLWEIVRSILIMITLWSLSFSPLPLSGGVWPQQSRDRPGAGPSLSLIFSDSSVLSSDPEPAQITVTPGVAVSSYNCGHSPISIKKSNNFFAECCKSWWVFAGEIAFLEIAGIKPRLSLILVTSLRWIEQPIIRTFRYQNRPSLACYPRLNGQSRTSF